MASPGVQRPESYTDISEIYSPSRHNPSRGEQLETSQYHCLTCGCLCSRLSNINQHFHPCINSNDNPNSLIWFDGVSNNSAGTQEQDSVEATTNLSKDTPSEFGISSSLEDEPGARRAMSKVDSWIAMAKQQAGAGISPSNNTQWTGSLNPTATEPNTNKSSLSDTPIVKRPALRLIVTPKPRVRFVTPPSSTRNEPTTPSSIRHGPPRPTRGPGPLPLQQRLQQQSQQQQQQQPQQPTPRVRRTVRTGHTENTAHLFNSAGLLMPSIPGIDSVTERLFDMGEIMSLRASRSSNDGYYPEGGEPVGGSFLMENWNAKKRKREG